MVEVRGRRSWSVCWLIAVSNKLISLGGRAGDLGFVIIAD